MSRTGRGNVEHDSASRIRSAVNNMPEGVSKALEKVKEINEEDKFPKVERAPIPDGLKDLVLFGKLTEDVTFGPYTFKIATLNAKQQKDILKRLFPLSNEDKVANLKIFTMAEALVSINGAPVESIYSGEDASLSVQEKKGEVLLQMQAAVIDKIYSKYEEMVKKSNSFGDPGGLDDSLKNS